MSRKFLLLAVLSAGLLGAVLIRPGSGPTICFSKVVLQADCPGCGLTRGVAAAAKGDLGSSVDFHPLAPLFLGILLFLWGLVVWSLIARKDLPPLRKFTPAAAVLCVLLLGFWLF